MKISRNLFFKTLLIASISAILLICVLPHEPGRRNFLDVLINPFSYTNEPQIGQMNGIPLSIPASYIFFPVEYEGESVWDKSRKNPERTYESTISNFSVYVQWPTMQPRQASNEASYQESLHTKGEHEWIMISPHAFPKKESYKNMNKDFLGRSKESRLNIFNSRSEDLKRAENIQKNVHYEVHDEKYLGLITADPVGDGTEKPELWNESIYWDSSPDGKIKTLIICPHKGFSDQIGHCEHIIEIPEFDAYISIVYKQNLLPKWQEIETETRKTLLSFHTT